MPAHFVRPVELAAGPKPAAAPAKAPLFARRFPGLPRMSSHVLALHFQRTRSTRARRTCIGTEPWLRICCANGQPWRRTEEHARTCASHRGPEVGGDPLAVTQHAGKEAGTRPRVRVRHCIVATAFGLRRGDGGGRWPEARSRGGDADRRDGSAAPGAALGRPREGATAGSRRRRLRRSRIAPGGSAPI